MIGQIHFCKALNWWNPRLKELRQMLKKRELIINSNFFVN